MRFHHLLCLCVLAVLMVSAAPVQAEIPQLINYQGQLADAVGNPVADGDYDIIFTIYDDSLSGTALWTETQSVPIENGQYSVRLGTVETLPDTVFSLNIDVFLAMQVVGDAEEMSPRLRLVASAFSFHALHADTALIARECLDGGGDGDITAVNADNGLTGGGTTGDVTLYIDSNWVDAFVDTSDVRYADSAGDLDCVGCVDSTHLADSVIIDRKIARDAVTASHIRNGTIKGQDIAPNGAATGQVLKYNGSIWAAADDETGGGSDDGDWTISSSNMYSAVSGNVGIGTTSPVAKLEVSSVLRLTPDDSPDPCGESLEGSIYYNSFLGEPCYCNGTSWMQMDGGGSCQDYCIDNDEDGYDICDPDETYDTDGLPADCDDDDERANQGETEVCDGIDNDCDGVIDDLADCINPGELVITEFMAEIVFSQDEWFEVYNASSRSLNLKGLSVSRQDMITHFTIETNLWVDPGDNLIFHCSITSPIGYVADYSWDSTFIDISGGAIIMYYNASTIIDEVWYGDVGQGTWPSISMNRSISLDPASYDATANDNGNNWCKGTSLYWNDMLFGSIYGTPGTLNDSCPAR